MKISYSMINFGTPAFASYAIFRDFTGEDGFEIDHLSEEVYPHRFVSYKEAKAAYDQLVAAECVL